MPALRRKQPSAASKAVKRVGFYGTAKPVPFVESIFPILEPFRIAFQCAARLEEAAEKSGRRARLADSAVPPPGWPMRALMRALRTD
jgi:hypothetical protein